MTEPDQERSRREFARLGWLVMFSLLSLIPIAVWNNVKEPGGPTEVVGAFLEAAIEGDIETALTYTRTDVPIGDEAAFLHSDAMEHDWEILSLSEHGGEYSYEADVKFTIGHPDGTAEGWLTVGEFDDAWYIENPYLYVDIMRGAQSTLRVGDRTIDGGSVVDLGLLGTPQRYRMLPGVYRFNGGEAETLLPSRGGDDDPALIAAANAEPTPDQITAAQAKINELIDDCLQFHVAAPTGCPFASDGEVDTPEGRRLTGIEDVTWTLHEYPEVTIAPAGDALLDDWGLEGLLRIEFTEPGSLELSGTGADTDSRTEFTTPCRFGTEELLVFLRGDGDVELFHLDRGENDSCRGTA